MTIYELEQLIKKMEESLALLKDLREDFANKVPWGDR